MRNAKRYAAPAHQQREKKTKTHADVNSCDSKIL